MILSQEVEDALNEVLYAWNVEGPKPSIHWDAKVRLMQDWPRLFTALSQMNNTIAMEIAK